MSLMLLSCDCEVHREQQPSVSRNNTVEGDGGLLLESFFIIIIGYLIIMTQFVLFGVTTHGCSTYKTEANELFRRSDK